MSEINKLVQQLKEGHKSAFAEIYSLYEKPLFNHLLKMLGSHQKAQEVFQDTMLTMIKKIDHYSHRNELKNSFKAWLFRIATNAAIDEIRKSKKVSFVENVPEVSVESHEVEINDFNERLNILIMRLPVIQRTFLNLKINEELSHLEIAAVCGCNVNAVKQGLFRARKSLKDLLINEGLSL